MRDPQNKLERHLVHWANKVHTYRNFNSARVLEESPQVLDVKSLSMKAYPWEMMDYDDCCSVADMGI